MVVSTTSVISPMCISFRRRSRGPISSFDQTGHRRSIPLLRAAPGPAADPPGVGLALRALDRLAHEEPEQRSLPGPVVLDLAGTGGQHRVDEVGDGALVVSWARPRSARGGPSARADRRGRPVPAHLFVAEAAVHPVPMRLHVRFVHTGVVMAFGSWNRRNWGYGAERSREARAPRREGSGQRALQGQRPPLSDDRGWRPRLGRQL